MTKALGPTGSLAFGPSRASRRLDVDSARSNNTTAANARVESSGGIGQEPRGR